MDPRQRSSPKRCSSGNARRNTTPSTTSNASPKLTIWTILTHLDASTRANRGWRPCHYAAIERNSPSLRAGGADGCRLPPLLSPLPVHQRRAERRRPLADFLLTIASKRESTPDPPGRRGRCSSQGALLQANRHFCSRPPRGLLECGSWRRASGDRLDRDCRSSLALQRSGASSRPVDRTYWLRPRCGSQPEFAEPAPSRRSRSELTNSTQRQLRPLVGIPLMSAPAQVPATRPRSRALRSVPSVNVVVMIERPAGRGDRRAQALDRTRHDRSSLRLGGPPASERSRADRRSLDIAARRRDRRQLSGTSKSPVTSAQRDHHDRV